MHSRGEAREGGRKEDSEEAPTGRKVSRKLVKSIKCNRLGKTWGSECGRKKERSLGKLGESWYVDV